ncbi:heme o synthase [Nannocystis radixulma]|uniref:Protoheme IX farnesyltransferase n=1 Tax=Nannocystis radixulma TaxID=2995305 RepID=A0ABT5BA25_9BACT|nr:heme o synthase [Nannocystis radixulma]MDC0670989.1 heme o synthase [Nannocystis radixulma]
MSGDLGPDAGTCLSEHVPAVSEPRRKRHTPGRDLWELTKPGVTRMCALTAAGAAWLALQSGDGPFPAETAADGWCSPGFAAGFAGVVGASLAVAAASAFNMWLERARDPLMPRTKDRPLAARRLSSATGLGFAALLQLASIAVLALFTNPLTLLLTLWATVGYVLVYTPLKYRTPLALLIGAFPGAAPPLLGWTAVTGQLDLGGLALFLILLVWQMPHFLAIMLFRRQEYARAGIRCVSVVRGESAARVQAFLWSLLLLPISVLPSVIGLTGPLYCAVALLLSLGFLGWALTGLRPFGDRATELRWARRFFFASLIYLPALIVALVLDVVLR